jgi:hypothetical protein
LIEALPRSLSALLIPGTDADLADFKVGRPTCHVATAPEYCM